MGNFPIDIVKEFHLNFETLQYNVASLGYLKSCTETGPL